MRARFLRHIFRNFCYDCLYEPDPRSRCTDGPAGGFIVRTATTSCAIAARDICRRGFLRDQRMLDGGGSVRAARRQRRRACRRRQRSSWLPVSAHPQPRRSTQAQEGRRRAPESAMNSGDSLQSARSPGSRRDRVAQERHRRARISRAADKRYARRAAMAAAGRQPKRRPDGWRPAVNFLQMNFTPPLGAVVPESASSFLAYTPSKVITAADGDRLTAMTSEFRQAGRNVYLERQLLPLRGDQHAAMLSASARADCRRMPRRPGLADRCCRIR